MTHPAETWHDATADAEAVARVLSTLDPAEWTVYRDLRWPTREFATLDHVVVGPKGVFVIDSLGWSGRVTVAKDEVRLNGLVRDSELVGAVEAAVAIAEMLHSVDAKEVQPVLCFVRDEWLTGTARGVLACSTANLESMLLGRSARLRRERVRAITGRLDRYDALNSRPVAPRPAADPDESATTTARRTGPLAVVISLVAMIAVLICVMILGF
ncbi:MAG: nuclease-related domain-containing protein [Nocardioides sp.]